MLSYQHAYHAGNLADLHKHAVLAWILGYLTRKDKPLSYIETHAGRGLYDLAGAEAQRTGEAAKGILARSGWFGPDHPYTRARQAVSARYGPMAYPGSPLIAQSLLRDTDSLHLAELHPGEHAALREAMGAGKTKIYQSDGLALAQSLCPPTPRRGLLLVDPSYEVKSDYDTIPGALNRIQAKWNVGIVMLWYPLLEADSHTSMLAKLPRDKGVVHEVAFAPVRPGHRMIGSGLYVANAPWGLEKELARLSTCFETL